MFFRKPFFQKFAVTPPTGGIRGWKNGLRGLVNPVRLGHVRKAIKSSIIWPTCIFCKFLKFSEKGLPRRMLGDERTDCVAYRIMLELGRVRLAKKVQKLKPWGMGPIHLLACFGWKLEITILERTTSFRYNKSLLQQNM